MKIRVFNNLFDYLLIYLIFLPTKLYISGGLIYIINYHYKNQLRVEIPISLVSMKKIKMYSTFLYILAGNSIDHNISILKHQNYC